MLQDYYTQHARPPQDIFNVIHELSMKKHLYKDMISENFSNNCAKNEIFH